MSNNINGSAKMDYFSHDIGYVIEGVVLGGANNARKYLVSVCDMTVLEANSFLKRLFAICKKQEAAAGTAKEA